jgi:hypothetical protein
MTGGRLASPRRDRRLPSIESPRRHIATDEIRPSGFDITL